MVQRPIHKREDFYPGLSSQTTSQWPLTVQLSEVQVRSSGVSLDGGGLVLQSQKERTWDEAVDEVMRDRSELWSELSDL
jgi:hypothetical protein